MNFLYPRRIIKDDGRGEALNEIVCVDQHCEGLTVCIQCNIDFASKFSLCSVATAIVILTNDNYRPGELTM